MKIVRVIEDACIGCGACEGIAPDTFELVDGISTVIDEVVTPENEDIINEAIMACPTDAIEIVETADGDTE